MSVCKVPFRKYRVRPGRRGWEIVGYNGRLGRYVWVDGPYPWRYLFDVRRLAARMGKILPAIETPEEAH